MVACSSTIMPDIDEHKSTTISAIHPDILSTHILTRLDGPTLASASCASSQLHSLSTRNAIWGDICNVTWPSTNHPHLRHLITTSPHGPRSFFSDCYPQLLPSPPSSGLDQYHLNRQTSPEEIISAVDIYYKNNCIFSKVEETETLSGWFHWSPFRMDLLDPKKVIQIPIESKNYSCQDLEQDLSLSWIIVDPKGRRAANFSTRRAVSVQRHWLTGEIELSFATILRGNKGSTEFVKCSAVITCGRTERGEVQMRDVSLQVKDMDGIILNGKESLGILQRAMDKGKRRKNEDEGKEIYLEYLERKKERTERKLTRERELDTMCKGFCLAALLALFMFVPFSS